MPLQGTAKKLDTSIRSNGVREFNASLSRKIVGQPEGIEALSDVYQIFQAGLSLPNHPVGNFLFLGPTGTGKTHLVEAAAEILFGNPRAFIKVDCAEFQHSHEIAKIIGSPPGYLGHRETNPLITQQALEQSYTENLKLSFLLFDEIEKASDALWQLLLGMLDKASLTLGDNRKVDLSRTVIFLTSNLGSREIIELTEGRMGFVPPTGDTEEKIQDTAVAQARKRFSPEFMNRLDKVVVFHPLTDDNLKAILDIELFKVQERITSVATKQFMFHATDAAKDFLLREGTDARYGARNLKRTIERSLVYPVANLLSSGQVTLGDFVMIDADEKGLVFIKETKKFEIFKK